MGTPFGAVNGPLTSNVTPNKLVVAAGGPTDLLKADKQVNNFLEMPENGEIAVEVHSSLGEMSSKGHIETIDGGQLPITPCEAFENLTKQTPKQSLFTPAPHAVEMSESPGASVFSPAPMEVIDLDDEDDYAQAESFV